MSIKGLVVGKFCPLHRGHQHLIDFARDRCDQLILISYTKPDFAGCATEKRAAWLEALYPEATRLVVDDAVLADFASRTGTMPRLVPHNDAPDAEQRAFVAWLCLTMLETTVDRVFTSEAYGDGFASALTDIFHHEVGYTGVVEHHACDPARRAVPISGSAIRLNPFEQSAHLPDIVRTGLVRRIALLGGESSGKSTLAAALAERFGTVWVHEYGRELWIERGGTLDFDDLLHIGEVQVAREEEALARAQRFLFCDTTPLVTAFYSQSLFGRVDPALEALALRRYDHSLLCAPDLPFVQDGHRRDAAYRLEQHDYYVAALEHAGAAFTLVEGSVEARLAQAEAVLREL